MSVQGPFKYLQVIAGIFFACFFLSLLFTFHFSPGRDRYLLLSAKSGSGNGVAYHNVIALCFLQALVSRLDLDVDQDIFRFW
jgi:hypothetical protein